jgi:hypothetical protein
MGWRRRRLTASSPPPTSKTLSNDPPLPFFVLFEAMQEPHEGRHLGPLGSIIVAEVIFGALALAPGSLWRSSDRRQLAGLSANYYPTMFSPNS